MLPLITALGGGSGIANLATGLFGIFGKKKKAQAPGVDYLKLRADAEAAGFNPLTALQAGGGAGYVKDFGPVMSPASSFIDVLGQGIDTWYNMAVTKDAEADQIRRETASRNTQELRRSAAPPGKFGYDLTDADPNSDLGGSVRAFGPALPPRGNPLYDHNRPKVDVLDPKGNPFKMDATTAEALMLKRFDRMSYGQWEEYVGSVRSEAESATDYLLGGPVFDPAEPITKPPVLLYPPTKPKNKFRYNYGRP